MPEWRPGVLEVLLKEITAVGRANFRAGGLLIAAAIEAKAKAELGRSSHPYGTPSPASRGGPPALVSGAGRRSIGHQYMPGVEPDIKIGTLTGVYPPRHGKSTTTTATSKYLLYQETLSRFDHPFLKPAFDAVVVGQVAIWLESFRAWPRI